MSASVSSRVVVDTLALIHLSGLRCNDVTHVDVGTRSGCHSNVPEIKAFFFNFFIYLLIILLVSVVSLVSGFSTCHLKQGGWQLPDLAAFRWFRWFRWFR